MKHAGECGAANSDFDKASLLRCYRKRIALTVR
jgi:hypothetical protein